MNRLDKPINVHELDLGPIVLDQPDAEVWHDRREFGDLTGIVYNKRTRRLIAGRGVCARIRREGLAVGIFDGDGPCVSGLYNTQTGKKVMDVRIVDWSEAKEHAARLLTNTFDNFMREIAEQPRALAIAQGRQLRGS